MVISLVVITRFPQIMDSTAVRHDILKLLKSIAVEENKINDLVSLKIILTHVSNVSMQDVLHGLSYESLFACLTSSDSEEEIVACCDVVELLFNSFSPSIVLNEFNCRLLEGLDSSSHPILLLCVKQIRKATNLSGSDVLNKTSIVLALLRLLERRECPVLSDLSSLFEALLSSPSHLSFLLSHFQADVARILASDSVARLRLLEIFINVSRGSTKCFDLLIQTDSLDFVRTIICGDDILLKSATLETFAPFMDFPEGVEWFEKSGCCKALDAIMEDIEFDTFAVSLLPGVLSIFTRWAVQSCAYVFSNYPSFPRCVRCIFQSGDSVLCLRCVEYVALIGHSVDSLELLDKEGIIDPCMLFIRQSLFGGAEVLMKEGCLLGTSKLLSQPFGAQSESLTKRIFQSLSPTNVSSQFLTRLTQLAKNPDVVVRRAVWKVINVCAPQQWALELFSEHPGFLEFLLERTWETDKRCKELKYDAIVSIVKKKGTDVYFNHNSMSLFQKYVEQGPYFVSSESSVALEME